MAAPSKIHIRDFSGGWNPSEDAFNSPPNILLRADNLVWDEKGVVRLRNGSSKVNVSPFAGAVNKTFTTTLNGHRVRMTGAGNSCYENGSLLSGAGSGAGDFSFGSHMGQIFATKGGLKAKWDGAVLRDWGIPDPATAPSAVQDSGNQTMISTTSAGFTNDTGEGAAPSFVAGVSGNAVRMTMDGTSFRGVVTEDLGGVIDLNDYSGEAGSDTDLIEFYVKLERSELLGELTIQFDASGGTADFRSDYFQVTLDMTTGVKVKLTPEQAVANAPVEGFERDRVRRNIRTQDDPTGMDGTEEGISVSRMSRAKDWTKISIPRGKMERVGSTSGLGWSTITGTRIIAQFTAAGGVVYVNHIQISGGASHALTGAFQFRYVHCFNSSKYVGKSQLSPASDPVDIKTAAALVTVPASSSPDVNETWVFVMGGGMNRFYRGGVIAGNGGTVSIGQSEVELVTLNITTENNSPPPDDIIGVVGPHAARTWVLTATQLCPSRRNNPDSFDLTQAITVGDDTETAYWVVLTTEGSLFVGTSKSIYSISGYGLEFPDGTTDFVKRTVQVEPPIDSGVTTDGYTVFYMASDGWRAFAGGVSQSILGTLDLLYKQEDRYGITAVNLGSGHARFRCAFLAGQLFTLSGEGITGNDAYSPALHVFDMAGPGRERRVYPFNIVSLYREPDGKILAGCTDGYVREIEVGSLDDTALIAATIITPAYIGETPLQYKDPFDLEVHADTGDATATVDLYVDTEAASTFSTSFSSSSMQAIVRRMETLTPFRAIQARITVSATIFTLRELTFNYRLRPQRRLYVDTGYIDTGANLNTWVRRIRLKARIKSAITCVPYFDDTAFPSYDSPAATPVDKVTHIQIPVPKNYKGRQPRVVIYAANNSSNPVVAGERMRIDEFSSFPSGAELTALERMRFATVGFAPGTPSAPETDHSFEAYWLEITYFSSGGEGEGRTQRIPIG